jgi:hypothetical protein
MRACFRNTAVALHVSFRIRTLPPSRGASSLRATLVALMEGMRELDPRQRAWLERLYGIQTERPSVNFSGLSALEIHGQCSMVVMACAQRLGGAELYAVMARYAQGAEKVVGIEGLADVMYRETFIAKPEVLAYLIARRYGTKHDRKTLTLGAISDHTGKSKSALFRLMPLVDDVCAEHERAAIRRLEQTFIPQGLVEEVTEL